MAFNETGTLHRIVINTRATGAASTTIVGNTSGITPVG